MKSSTQRRSASEVNAGSMADIAFLLLIFFLVTTTIMSDKGVLVKLPPYSIEESPLTIYHRNVFRIAINANNQLLVRNEVISIDQLRERVKTFILNPDNIPSLAVASNQAILSLVNDRGTRYETYIEVYNELKAAYNEMWNETAQIKYGTWFDQLTPTQQRSIRNQIPMVISEAEPTDHANGEDLSAVY